MSKPKYALLSVSNKTGIEELAKFFIDQGFKILSTGGTAKLLQQHKELSEHIIKVSDITNYVELFDGRVKTLHPKIAGGILHKRKNLTHQLEAIKHEIPDIQVVVCNLYPFHKIFDPGVDMRSKNIIDEACDLIDIGGVTLIRSAAKNFRDVLVITDPEDYEFVMKNWPHNFNRMKFAKRAFRHTCEYDGMILEFFSEGKEVNRIYEETNKLKYGCNPFQTLASIHSVNGSQLPFNILNGSPGYINILDAVGCWGLVNDLSDVCSEVLGKYVPASCSFKHTSPAGAAIGATPLSQKERHAFFVSKKFDGKELNEICTAYIRARHSDPLSSFGDFIGVSGVVDEDLANLIRIEICDGIVAKGYTADLFLLNVLIINFHLQLYNFSKKLTAFIKF